MNCTSKASLMYFHLNVGSRFRVPQLYKIPSIIIKHGYLGHKERELCLKISGYSVGTHTTLKDYLV